MSKRKHRGSDFRNFLKEQGLLGEVEARALKQAMSLQISRLLEEKSVYQVGNGGPDENQPRGGGPAAGCFQLLGHTEHAGQSRPGFGA